MNLPVLPAVPSAASIPVDRAPAAIGPRPRRPAVPRRPVHGVLLLDKPAGLSSNDALQRAKRLFRAEKAGHTGTLDPLATGLLPLCFGAATKFSHAGLDADKTYRAVLALGRTTTTGDAEGAVVRERPVAVMPGDVAAACRCFTGTIDQLPPMHSALKHEGRALYDYARAGIEIERAPRRVMVHAIDLVAFDGDRLTLAVRCSKGTYVRTLAEDLGETLGCGAHLAALRRTASGALDVSCAYTLEALADLDEAGRDALLAPVDALLADLPEVVLDAADAARFLTGLRRRLGGDDGAADRPLVRVLGPAPSSATGRAFLGTGRITAQELFPVRLLSPTDVQAVADAAARRTGGLPNPLRDPA